MGTVEDRDGGGGVGFTSYTETTGVDLVSFVVISDSAFVAASGEDDTSSDGEGLLGPGSLEAGAGPGPKGVGEFQGNPGGGGAPPFPGVIIGNAPATNCAGMIKCIGVPCCGVMEAQSGVAIGEPVGGAA